MRNIKYKIIVDNHYSLVAAVTIATINDEVVHIIQYQNLNPKEVHYMKQ